MKLPEELRGKMLKNRQGRRFRYFPTGPIKKEYVVLSRALAGDPGKLRRLLAAGAQYVRGS